MKKLIIFAKLPAPGMVKTRLAASTPLDEAKACQLYEAMLRDTITMATLTEAESIAIHHAPADGGDAMKKLVRKLKLGARNENKISYIPQQGESFTERIAHAFATSGGEEDALLMIGADAPLIQPKWIDHALDFIESRDGVALGPSSEGGLYLIGHPGGGFIDYATVFAEGSEFLNLCDQAGAKGAPLHIAPETVDVDLESDLVSLVGLIGGYDYARSWGGICYPGHTAAAIKELGLTVVRDGEESRAKKISLVSGASAIPAEPSS